MVRGCREMDERNVTSEKINEYMNNKMTLWNFLEVGGGMEIRLLRDFQMFGIKPERLF